jgi:hypothetical protein
MTPSVQQQFHLLRICQSSTDESTKASIVIARRKYQKKLSFFLDWFICIEISRINVVAGGRRKNKIKRAVGGWVARVW